MSMSVNGEKCSLSCLVGPGIFNSQPLQSPVTESYSKPEFCINCCQGVKVLSGDVLGTSRT